MDVVFDVDSGSAIKTWSGVGDAGACCRLCTSTWGCAAFSAFAHTETQAASCVLFADTSHQVVGVNNVTSARVIKTPTHYLDPQKGPCASDETIRGWLSKGGTGPALQLCSQECDPKAAFPCPLDIPDGAIGSPKCDLNGNAFPDLFCALNCTGRFGLRCWWLLRLRATAFAGTSRTRVLRRTVRGRSPNRCTRSASRCIRTRLLAQN